MPYRRITHLRKHLALEFLDAGHILGSASIELEVETGNQQLPRFGILFSGDLGDTQSAEFLFNITNDAWFGVSAGPYQHFASARLRAVEEGLPLVRAANTGISAVIDPYGRILHRVALGEAGRIDSSLPRPLPLTLYARWGDLPFFVLLAAALGVVWRWPSYKKA